MKTILTIIKLIFAVAILITGCDRPTTAFEKNNPNDPLNENFIPPVRPGLSVSYTPDNTVILNWWVLQPEIIDGFLIEKGTDSGNFFNEIGRVGPDVTTFTDNSENRTGNELYRVVPFIKVKNQIYPTAYIIGVPFIQDAKNLETQYINPAPVQHTRVSD